MRRFSWTSVQADYDYASTQVNLDAATAKKLMDWGKENIPDDDLYDEDGTQGREDKPHITILYGLVEDDPQPVIDLLQGKSAPKATLGKVSLFSKDEYDVVKVEVKSEDLAAFQKILWDGVEHESDYPDYKPHATIAYVQPGSGSRHSGSTDFEGMELTFDTVIFSPSDDDAERTSIPLKGIAASLHWNS
jgi:2'-5' RNA ligase